MLMKLSTGNESILQKKFSLRSIQKNRGKLGWREGSSNLTQNDTQGEGGVHKFNFYSLHIFIY